MQKIVTHNGSFHADDVFAVAALQLHLGVEETKVIRTRDEAEIAAGDWVVDVGDVYDPAKRRFDHHQGGAPVRDNGIPYAAFGLVWEALGVDLAGSAAAAAHIDERLVQPIDAGDNGVSLYDLTGPVAPFEMYNLVNLHAPVWGSAGDKDAAFLEAVAMARTVLLKAIAHAQAGEAAEQYAKDCYEAATDKRVVICDQSVGKGHFVDYNDVLFVVTPAEDGTTWRATALPKDHHTFETRLPFPASWRGLRDEELQTASGIADAKFVHKAGFLFVAESKEGVLEAVEKALQS